jgi:ribonuclease R
MATNWPRACNASTMADDYYRFVETAHMLRGENTHRVYRLGDKVRVQVIRVNMDLRQIELGLVEILERVRAGDRGPGHSTAKPRREAGRRATRPGRRERRSNRQAPAGRRRK